MARLSWALPFLLLLPFSTRAQLDPEKRRLIQLGYNQHLEGRGPIAGYGFFYYNKPDFFKTNVTLRLAIAPIYLDSEIGFKSLLGPNTDFGIGLAGGGYADSYSEIRKGVYRRSESFLGHGGEVSLNLYHLFDPDRQIPLWGILRGSWHHTVYERDSKTDPGFHVPPDRETGNWRAGLRLGGQSPNLNDPLAMELSIWYDAHIRSDDSTFGYAQERRVEPVSHLFWSRALIKYTFDPSEQWAQLTLTAGSSEDADQFSAYRIGSMLPFSAELPLNLPGYYFQEITARSFALLNVQYAIPVDPAKDWEVTAFGGTALVDYLPGFAQPGNWHSGVGSGVTWISPSSAWMISLLYGYGVDAIRSDHRGANSIALLLQYDFEAKARHKRRFLPWINPYKSRGGERLFYR